MFQLIYQCSSVGEWNPNSPPQALSFPVTNGKYYLLMARASVTADNHTVGALFTLTDPSGTQTSGGSAAKSPATDYKVTLPMVMLAWQCAQDGQATIALSNNATAYGAYNSSGTIYDVSVSVAEIDGVGPTL